MSRQATSFVDKSRITIESKSDRERARLQIKKYIVTSIGRANASLVLRLDIYVINIDKTSQIGQPNQSHCLWRIEAAHSHSTAIKSLKQGIQWNLFEIRHKIRFRQLSADWCFGRCYWVTAGAIKATLKASI